MSVLRDRFSSVVSQACRVRDGFVAAPVQWDGHCSEFAVRWKAGLAVVLSREEPGFENHRPKCLCSHPALPALLAHHILERHILENSLAYEECRKARPDRGPRSPCTTAVSRSEANEEDGCVARGPRGHCALSVALRSDACAPLAR